jgi:hypothetical protein
MFAVEESWLCASLLSNTNRTFWQALLMDASGRLTSPDHFSTQSEHSSQHCGNLQESHNGVQNAGHLLRIELKRKIKRPAAPDIQLNCAVKGRNLESPPLAEVYRVQRTVELEHSTDPPLRSVRHARRSGRKDASPPGRGSASGSDCGNSLAPALQYLPHRQLF